MATIEKYKTKREQPCRTCGRIIQIDEMVYQILVMTFNPGPHLLFDCEACGQKRMEGYNNERK